MVGPPTRCRWIRSSNVMGCLAAACAAARTARNEQQSASEVLNIAVLSMRRFMNAPGVCAIPNILQRGLLTANLVMNLLEFQHRVPVASTAQHVLPSKHFATMAPRTYARIGEK